MSNSIVTSQNILNVLAETRWRKIKLNRLYKQNSGCGKKDTRKTDQINMKISSQIEWFKCYKVIWYYQPS